MALDVLPDRSRQGAAEIVLEGDPADGVGITMGRKSGGLWLQQQAYPRRRRVGVALHVINDECVMAEIVTALQRLVRFVAFAVERLKSGRQVFHG